MNTKQQRIDWIDIAKALGIIYVIVGHVLYNEQIKNWFISFHMPLFLFLSGLLYKKRNIRNLVFTKSRTMLKPYYLFALLSVVYYWLIECRFRDLSYTVSQSILGGMLCYIPFMNNAPLWYLPCAFIIVITYRLLREMISSKQILLIGIMMNCVYWISGSYGLLYRFSYELPRVLDLFCYYSIGAFISEKELLSLYENNSHRVLLRKIGIIMLSLFLYGIGFYLSINEIYKYPIASIIIALFGIVGTVGLSLLINSKVLRIVGNSSLFVLCIHSPIYRILVGALCMVTHKPSDTIRSSIIISIGITLLTIAICVATEKGYYTLKKTLNKTS